jgi:hypothetical protein
MYLKAKEEEEEVLWKLKYFTTQKYNLQNKSSKRKKTKILQDIYYYNFVTKFLKFQHKPKLSSFKNPHI